MGFLKKKPLSPEKVGERIRLEQRSGQGELKGLVDERAVESLIVFVLDSSETDGDRIVAARALGRIGDPRAVDPLVEVLNHGLRDGASEDAGKALVQLGDAGIDGLIRALEMERQRGGRPGAGQYAARFLGQAGRTDLEPVPRIGPAEMEMAGEALARFVRDPGEADPSAVSRAEASLHTIQFEERS